MGVQNVLLLSQTTAQALVGCLSFTLIVPMWMHLLAFNDHCALSSTAILNSSTSPYPATSVLWSSGISCDYTIFVGAVTLVLSLVRICSMGYKLYKDTNSSFLGVLLNTLVSGGFTILALVAAMAVTFGFQMWCQSLENISHFNDKCRSISYGFKLPGLIEDGASFYIDLSIVEFGAWTSFAVWILITSLSVGKLYSFHLEESIITSLKKERERLFPAKSTLAVVYQPIQKPPIDISEAEHA